MPLVGEHSRYSARCTFDIPASPQISCFVSEEFGAGHLVDLGFLAGTPSMCSTHSVLSSCITGEQKSLTLSGKVGSFVALGTHTPFVGE